MITQLEFETLLAALDPPPPPPPRQSREDLNAADYAIALAAAIKAHNMPQSAFNVLLSVARQQTLRGFATIPQIALDLRLSYQGIRHHLDHAPELLTITADPAHPPQIPGRNLGNFALRASLNHDGVRLLASIQRQAKRIARHHAAKVQT